jgi:hypothetical protein
LCIGKLLRSLRLSLATNSSTPPLKNSQLATAGFHAVNISSGLIFAPQLLNRVQQEGLSWEGMLFAALHWLKIRWLLSGSESKNRVSRDVASSIE